MSWQSGHNTRPHVRLPPHFLDIDDLTTERSFDSQVPWDMDALGSFVDMLSKGVFSFQIVQLSFADFRSTGARIKCLYSIPPQAPLIKTYAHGYSNNIHYW